MKNLYLTSHKLHSVFSKMMNLGTLNLHSVLYLWDWHHYYWWDFNSLRKIYSTIIIKNL